MRLKPVFALDETPIRAYNNHAVQWRYGIWVPVQLCVMALWGHRNYCLRERLNGIQEVSGSIPLISTNDIGDDVTEKF